MTRPSANKARAASNPVGDSLDRLLATLSSDPGRRGREWEEICRWYLLNDPIYRRELSNVWHWREWPGRWGSDAGIDLVARTKKGELWAVQAKAYSPNTTITKADVDTFLSESARPQFSYRLLLATTDRLGRTGQRTLDAQEKRVGYVLLTQLRHAPLTWPRTVQALRPAKPRPSVPRTHQRKAIRSVVAGLKNNDRGRLIMACGTGKTLTALWIAKELRAQRTLVLVPSLSLLRQTRRSWALNDPAAFESLAVCSDETVAEDESVAHTSELGFPVTTAAGEIASFLRRTGRLIVFSTYQSSPEVATAFRRRKIPPFDLVIADEAHRTTGLSDSPFGTVLADQLIRARKRVFMTATPRVFSPHVKKKAAEAAASITSMDDVHTYGPELHRFTFGQAIAAGMLTDYQVAVVGVLDEQAKRMARSGSLVRFDGKTTDARRLASQLATLRSMKRFDLRRVITFHSRIDAANRFAEELPDVRSWLPARERPHGTFSAGHVSSRMSTGAREALIDSLRYLQPGERRVLANARCLGEGVDVPALDGIAFIDPRRSQIDIVQAVGRAIRRATDKKVGTVILPVFVSAHDKPDEILSTSEFGAVWDVLNALRSHDEVLGEELDELRRSLGESSGRIRTPGKLVVDLPVPIGEEFRDAFIIELIRATTQSWDEHFGALRAYAKKHEHARVPQSYVERGLRLGAWVNRQRLAIRQGDLSAERRARLRSLPGWQDDVHQKIGWEEALTLLRAFVEREGHALVPGRHAENGFSLGAWVNSQRMAYRSGSLSRDRRRRLAVVPGWAWSVPEEKWDRSYKALLAFAKTNGHAAPKDDYRCADGLALGSWVQEQRAKIKTGRLSKEKRTLLEKLPGWVIDALDARWRAAYQALRLYVERTGTASVPDAHREGGIRLGEWVTAQRAAAHAGKLSADRRRLLQRLAGWSWSVKQSAWTRALQQLKRFRDTKGHASVPQAFVAPDGFTLGRWLTSVRKRLRDGTLPAAETRQLRDLGVVADPLEDSWQRAFTILNRYVLRRGWAALTQTLIVDGFRLGTWVNKQRQRYRMKTLSDSRRRQLQRVPGWQWTVPNDGWDRHFSALRAYSKREGHSNVPANHREQGLRLGSWLQAQRQAMRGGRMRADRKRLLEGMPGFELNPHQAKWERGFGALRTFVARHGHAATPTKEVVDGFALGLWVRERRNEYAAGRLAKDRAVALERLPGWVWNTRTSDWETAYDLLRAYATQHRNTSVSGNYAVDGRRLAGWIKSQRRAYRLRQLPHDRVRKLQALPGWRWRAK